MAAYVLANVEITDPAGFEEYRKAVPATIARYGGRYLTRGGTTDALEGSWLPKRVVLLEFPSAARAREWYGSPEYRPLIALRQRTTKSDVTIIDGI
ncbi:MAG TPA: DUF1330 domain-containing protein [Steroidobacteraceae bacterium]|nr:DUF1330 domain-containing protein [Steroidobacteraceae bacterium]